MLLKKLPIYIISALCLIAIYSLFYIKNSVTAMKSELAEVNKQVQNEVDSIHLFKAELTYLRSPSRLAQLNEKYLHLSEIKASQMINDPSKKEGSYSRQIVSSKVKGHNIKWRYKKNHHQYLTMVSGKK